MKLLFTPEAWEDYLYWLESERNGVRRVSELVRDTLRNPFKGIGKPEPLKGNLAGWWSRRITGEHRLVYRVTGKGADQQLEISSCRYHY